ncbi:unnamed protein product [Agarophyton chilense]
MEQYGPDKKLLSRHTPDKERNQSPKRKRKFSIVQNDSEPSTINQQPKNPIQEKIINLNMSKQSLCARVTRLLSPDGQNISINMDNNEQDPLTVPPEERQKLARAKRNREAAYRSRAKNKIRQCAVEEDTRKNMALNTQLRSMLEFLLQRLRTPSTSENVAQENKRRKHS